MPLPNNEKKLIQQGAWCNIQVIINKGDPPGTIGLVNMASFNEDNRVAPAEVLGHFGPVSLDPQSYSCTIQIGSFVPLKKDEGKTEAYLDGGTSTFQDTLKTRGQIAVDGRGTQYYQIDFIDTQSGVVYNSFQYCVVSSYGANISPSAYVTGNIQMMAIARTI